MKIDKERLKKLAKRHKVEIRTAVVGALSVSTIWYLCYKIYRGDFEDASVVIKEVGDKIIIEET